MKAITAKKKTRKYIQHPPVPRNDQVDHGMTDTDISANQTKETDAE